MSDPVNHPPHYTGHPSGVECITIVQHMGFCLGNVVKYVWRADLKGNAVEDLEKARFYLDQEIARRNAEGVLMRGCAPTPPPVPARKPVFENGYQPFSGARRIEP